MSTTPELAARGAAATGAGDRLIRNSVLVLTALCTAPVIGFFVISQYLDAGCTRQIVDTGSSGPSLVWQIERESCGGAPVHNLLVGPRGKTLALAASFTGQPVPGGVAMQSGAHFVTLLDASGREAGRLALPLKATGRPAAPLVVADGMPK